MTNEEDVVNEVTRSFYDMWSAHSAENEDFIRSTGMIRSSDFYYSFSDISDEEFEEKSAWIRMYSSGLADSVGWEYRVDAMLEEYEISYFGPIKPNDNVLSFVLHMIDLGRRGTNKEDLYYVNGGFSHGSAFSESKVFYEMFNCGLLVPENIDFYEDYRGLS